MEDEERRKLEKPTTTVEEAATLAETLYGISAHADGIKLLDSYDDRNFFVPSLGEGGPFLLKVHNGVESSNAPVLEAQNAIMQHIKSKGFDCPIPILSKNGKYTEHTEAGSPPRRFAVRMLTWVDGRTMNSLEPSRDRLLQAGEYLGRLQDALTAFDHPGCHREHLWDIRSTPGLRKFLACLDDAPDVRTTVLEVVESYEALSTDIMSKLKKSVLQADFNDANIIFSHDGTSVSGVIDFGDIVFSNSINDLAIAMAYSMLRPPKGLNVVETAATLLEGFCRTAEVTSEELEVLRVLIACRLATSVTLGAFSSSKDTADNEYLELHAAPGRAALCAFWGMPVLETCAQFQSAVIAGSGSKHQYK